MIPAETTRILKKKKKWPLVSYTRTQVTVELVKVLPWISITQERNQIAQSRVLHKEGISIQ